MNYGLTYIAFQYPYANNIEGSFQSRYNLTQNRFQYYRLKFSRQDKIWVFFAVLSLFKRNL